MKLLLLNNFRGILKKKIQLVGIIVLVILSIAIYVGINSAIDRLENSYYNYLNEQNVEDISVYVNIDYSADINIEVLDDLRTNELADVTYDENIILDNYRNYLLDENRKYDLVLTNNVKNIFEHYGADKVIHVNILDSLMDEYDFVYEFEESKILTNNEVITKILSYDTEGLNKTYLIEGKIPESDNEINILPRFAEIHNIKIGDKFIVEGREYSVVGFSYASDYIYPLISVSTPIFDEEVNNIIFMTDSAFREVNCLVDNVYSIKYNYEYPRRFELSIDEELTDGIFSDEHIMTDLNTVTRITRIGTLGLEFDTNRLFAEYFLCLILIISFIVILVIMKKQIDSDRLQIGILKSIGYNNHRIAVSYLLCPILIFIVGGILGFVIGYIIYIPISKMLLSFYCVPLDDFIFLFDYLSSLLILLFVLSVLIYLFVVFQLRKQNTVLLKDGSNLKVNFCSRLLNKCCSLLPFEFRFKYSLAFRSIGRLLLVSLIAFCTGLLIVLVLICSNLFSGIVDKSFDGVNYNYIVGLNGIETSVIGDSLKSDYILSVNMNLIKIIDSNGTEKDINDDIDFTFTGIDNNSKFIDILSDGDVINHKLENDNIIVNKNIKELYDLEIGDKLEFQYGDMSFNYNVIGFNDEYTGYNIYIDRGAFSNDLGFELPIYNSIYSNDSIYDDLSNLSNEDVYKILNVISVDDLKVNMIKQMDGLNSIIYPIIICASIVIFIITLIAASIIVDENKKTISLMKTMGYNDKKISYIILNIYTPFIILSYFLAIPVMRKILKIVAMILVNNINFVMPINISWKMVLLGLLCLLISYYIALFFSKRTLQKVPMSVILKNE